MHKAIALFALVCALAIGQTANTGQTVNLSSTPEDGITRLSFYDGSGYEIYRCEALALQASYSWTRAASTLTNVVVSSNVGTVTTSTAHGLTVGNRVVIAGSTTAALNGTYKIVTVATTTFTITTAGVGDATYNNAAMTLATTAPRTTAAIWAVRSWTYTGANQDTGRWATTSLSTVGKVRMTSVCDNRATLYYN